jgi:transposase
MTFLAALRHDRIDAPWFIEGPIDGASFRAYVEKVLLPTLRPGDVVVMDNLGSHKGKVVRQLIRSAGAKLFFLPKYSPDLNPIEQVFAKLKHLLRKAAARTVDTVCTAIAEVLDAFTPEECANYLKNSGYQPNAIALLCNCRPGAPFNANDRRLPAGFLPRHQAGSFRARPQPPSHRRYTRMFPRSDPPGILAGGASPRTRRGHGRVRILVGAPRTLRSLCWPTLVGPNRQCLEHRPR